MPGGDQGGQSQEGSDAGQQAAGKALKAAKGAADDARHAGQLAASGGTDVTSWIHFIKKYLLPAIAILSMIFLIIVFAVISLLVSFAASTQQADATTCGTDLSVMATNGPVNVGDKFPNPRGGITTITEEMMGNAQIIVRVGQQFTINGVAKPIPINGMVIAIGVSLMEAGLINLDHGDASSVGLFQQLKLHGTFEQRHNPEWSSHHFYEMLLGTKGWEQMSLGAAADATQRPLKDSSALYQGYMPTAAGLVQSILDAFSSGGGTPTVNVDATATTDPSAAVTPGEDGSCVDPSIPTDYTAGECRDATSPGGTIQITKVDPPGVTVNCTIAAQVAALYAAAAADGVQMAGWGYRDPADQIRVRKNNCGTSYYAIYQMKASSCHPPTAIPGTSRHEYGLAIDFTQNGSTLKRGSTGFNWMVANAGRFGLKNLPSEPWHWSTTGG